jgi:hypothetical protein
MHAERGIMGGRGCPGDGPGPSYYPPPAQTGPTDCLHQCGIKPTVFDSRKCLNINTSPSRVRSLILLLRDLLARRDDVYRVQSI